MCFELWIVLTQTSAVGLGEFLGSDMKDYKCFRAVYEM